MNDEPVRVRVLVVCAEPRVCDILARFLAQSDIDVQIAKGPEEATLLLDGQSAAIVELDGPRPAIVTFLLAARSHKPRMRLLGLGTNGLDNVKLDAHFPLPVDPERILLWLAA